MNAPIPAIWTTGSTEGFKTGTWRASLPQHILAPAPCHAACPVNGDIAEWIGRARARDFRGAWEVLTQNNPFPAIAGRVCHHPCEAACNRGGFDEPLAICKLERFVGDLALAEGWAFDACVPAGGARVAIVGGGPSGLAAAFQLRRRGYAISLYESQPNLGGLMRHGIPSYRLPRHVLEGEISRIVALGIDVRRGQRLATPADFARLRAEYDAVYLAVGAQRPKRLPALDYARPWVVDGAAYLARANAGEPPALGRRVVVIGGGSAALDAARSARRAGHGVTILALESAAQMPAQRAEVAEALEEGVVLVDSAQLASVNEEHAGLRLTCVRVRFEAGTERGQFTAAPIGGSEFTLEADAIMSSIGQDPELAPVAGALETARGLVRVDADQSTSAAGVYAGGDLVSMARFVTEAIAMGNRAARTIDRSLSAVNEQGVRAPQSAAQAIVALDNIATHYYPPRGRAIERRLTAAQRLVTGEEVQLGLDPGEALAESGRCFSCGTCIFCDNCVQYCPDLAVRRVRDDGVDRYTVLTDYCKGCGLCVKECPTGSMKMVEEIR